MGLKELRVRANLSQREVANVLEVDQSAVCHWEKGDNKPVKKYRQKLARLFCVPESELFKEN